MDRGGGGPVYTTPQRLGTSSTSASNWATLSQRRAKLIEGRVVHASASPSDALDEAQAAAGREAIAAARGYAFMETGAAYHFGRGTN